jgi:hypothetical protein
MRERAGGGALTKRQHDGDALNLDFPAAPR